MESDTTPTSHQWTNPIGSTLQHLEEPENNIIEKDLGHMQANQRLFYLIQLQQSIWNRWKTEFLSFRRERQEANKLMTSQIAATEGDIVLVYDNTPRLTWKMGRFEEFYKGNGGKERSVRVGKQGCDITRALYKLNFLELTTIEESKPNETADDLRGNNTSVVEMSEIKNDQNLSSDCRPRCKAFTKALKCLEETLNDDDLNEKEFLPMGVCREHENEFTHNYE